MKIFGRMLNPWSPTSPDDSFAVVGSDSDLFLMALLRPAADNLWVLPDSRDAKARRSPHSFSLQALGTEWGKLPQVTRAGSSQVPIIALQMIPLVGIAHILRQPEHTLSSPPRTGPALETARSFLNSSILVLLAFLQHKKSLIRAVLDKFSLH